MSGSLLQKLKRELEETKLKIKKETMKIAEKQKKIVAKKNSEPKEPVVKKIVIMEKAPKVKSPKARAILGIKE